MVAVCGFRPIQFLTQFDPLLSTDDRWLGEINQRARSGTAKVPFLPGVPSFFILADYDNLTRHESSSQRVTAVAEHDGDLFRFSFSPSRQKIETNNDLGVLCLL